LGLVHFFEPFPNGWDQAEYAWCVQSGYLPHSPYILFFLAGRFFHLFLDAAAALSLLSVLSGLLCIVLFYLIQLRLFSSGTERKAAAPSGRAMAASSSILMGLSYVFIRQASSQEVYAFQTLLLLLSIFILLARLEHGAIYSGVVYGCAVAAHSASLFLLPAIAYAVIEFAPRSRDLRVRSLLIWLSAAGATCVSFCLLIYLILPAAHQAEFLAYLRGISPSPPFESWSAGFWARSIRRLFLRLSSLSVPVSRGAMATTPLGLSLFHLLAAGLGMVLCLRLATRQGVFWLLYLAPYTLYEVLLGMNLDHGIYLPLVLPPLWSFTAFAVLASFKGREPRRLRSPSIALRSAVLLSFLAPSAFLIVRHWSDPERDAVAHYTPATLGAIWMSRNLPQDALVIQSSKEWNGNLLPYYSRRPHVLRSGPLLLFVDRGKFTPMNLSSYEPLTTDFLRSVIASGRPVYAFEREPLKGKRTDLLDPGAFEWEVAASPSLDSVQRFLPVPESVRSRLFRGVILLYRARLR
jgi:hypothetical protein